MLTPDRRLVRILIDEEIERLVLEAAPGSRTIIRSGERARALLRAYPNCGMKAREVIDAIVAAAAAEKVPVEIADTDEPAF